VGARLGQHFLFDPSILGRIADAAAIRPEETVLEIGPGKGTLTAQLAARAAAVVAIEADGRLAAALRERALPRVEVVHGDALRVQWPVAHRVCGNIPYRITSPLIERALTPPRPRCVVFLVQREVADRIAAPPGSRTYGALSAGVQLVARVERLFGVPRGAFRPPPRVDSAVIRLTPHEPALDSVDEALTRRVIREAFQHRRQQLRRTLAAMLALTKEEAELILGAAGIEPSARPETLSAERFLVLARALDGRPPA